MSLSRSLVVYSLAIAFSGAVLLPLFWMSATAVRPSSEILSWPPVLLPQNVTLDHFVELFRATNFSIYVGNSLAIAVMVVVLVNLASVGGGYALSRSAANSVRIAAMGSLVGYMIAPIMIIVPFYLAMKGLGLANSRWALVLAHTSFCLPFALWLMKSYVDDVPLELEKAARVDGAGRLATLLLVVVPQIRAGIGAVSILTFILSWNDYIFARILVSDDAAKTIPVGLEDLSTATVVDWGLLMAAGVIVTLPVLVGFAAVQRTLIRGWGHSGLKG